MSCPRPASLTRFTLALLAASLVCEGQIGGQGGGYPGGYPPGGTYPGGGYPSGRQPMGGGGIPGWPRRGKKDKKTAPNAEALTVLSGMVRTLDAKQLVMETGDKRILTVYVTSATKFLKADKPLDPGSLQAGDHVNTGVTQDDHGFYFASTITLEKPGTPQERAAASQAADVSPVADESGPRDKDDERPILRRKGDPAPETAKSSRPSSPKAPEPGAGNLPAGVDDDGYVRRPTTVLTPGNSSEADAEDGAPPKTRRGAPPKYRVPAAAPQVAVNRPAAPIAAVPQSAPRERAAEPQAVHAEPIREEAGPKLDRVIEKARDAAESFSETLPNYVVKQMTTRFYSKSSSREPNWQAIDNVTADVVYDGGKESYKNVLVNGKAPKEKVEKSGSWSTGEFATVLRDLFSPSSAADFRPKGSDTVVHRAAYVYSFTVEQPNSHWHVYMAAQSYRPAYKGTVWIDKENFRVLRIEMQGRNLPRDFPIDTVESATDYDYVRLGSGTFLLPAHSESLSCVRGTSECSRNVIEFRNYKKFGSESEIRFGEAAK